MINNSKLNKAFTLVEVLVAVAIFTVSILGLMSVLTSGVSSTTYAKQKIIATYLAQEGIEYVRNMRDTDVLYDATSPQNGWSIFNTALSSCTSSGCGFARASSLSLPLTLFSCSPPLCNLKINASGGYATNAAGGADSGFVRQVWATVVNTNETKIFSKVSWPGSTTPSVTFSESLFNWVQ